ncbi:hypothetical protein KMW28_04260 [Flammeovirga yaeyamensis]|uniref:Ig-like domain-containing protein n=2 Tax=Flammeovirga TaxID=59739 RepID=A0AAX1NAT6_9BACT|nr:hypothetical protein [Flammeovirga yaeyamensis]MBB3697369.1 hypothetical protein [Flammeovirga yaeyamensis]NMF36063.1 hypothetical protein [Flammeovirga yaeyamensis]QWG02798.1 hypothetical protein KMW28_04260 [Flammeovirga yaeyamensis]
MTGCLDLEDESLNPEYKLTLETCWDDGTTIYFYLDGEEVATMGSYSITTIRVEEGTYKYYWKDSYDTRSPSETITIDSDTELSWGCDSNARK